MDRTLEDWCIAAVHHGAAALHVDAQTGSYNDLVSFRTDRLEHAVSWATLIMEELWTCTVKSRGTAWTAT